MGLFNNPPKRREDIVVAPTGTAFTKEGPHLCIVTGMEVWASQTNKRKEFHGVHMIEVGGPDSSALGSRRKVITNYNGSGNYPDVDDAQIVNYVNAAIASGVDWAGKSYVAPFDGIEKGHPSVTNVLIMVECRLNKGGTYMRTRACVPDQSMARLLYPGADVFLSRHGIDFPGKAHTAPAPSRIMAPDHNVDPDYADDIPW